MLIYSIKCLGNRSVLRKSRPLPQSYLCRDEKRPQAGLDAVQFSMECVTLSIGCSRISGFFWWAGMGGIADLMHLQP